MVKMIPVRIKMELYSFIWEKHDDHPLVGPVPDQLRNQIPNSDIMGFIQDGGKLTVIGPGTRLIESGGRVFPVDDNYYHLMYEEVEEIKQEIVDVANAEVTERVPVGWVTGPEGNPGV